MILRAHSFYVAYDQLSGRTAQRLGIEHTHPMLGDSAISARLGTLAI